MLLELLISSTQDDVTSLSRLSNELSRWLNYYYHHKCPLVKYKTNTITLHNFVATQAIGSRLLPVWGPYLACSDTSVR